jgi:hypothetical protein
MLIFDRFPNEENAREFMAAITKEFGLTAHFARSEDGYLFRENQKANEEAPMRGALEVFPFELKPPIVLIERPQASQGGNKSEIESKVGDRVRMFGGEYAGT